MTDKKVGHNFIQGFRAGRQDAADKRREKEKEEDRKERRDRIEESTGD